MTSNIAEYLRNNFNLWLVRYRKYQASLNPQTHQLTNTTKHDRYPEIFKAVQYHFKNSKIKPQKILSFGCSTGEECTTILDYFPKTEVVGTDINRKILKKCNERYQQAELKFVYSEPELIQAESPFDIIFCLSVLCRWEETRQTDNCGSIYPFVRFEQQLNLLDQFLSPGGLLVIYNSNFRFSESKLYKNYQPILSNRIKDSGFVHKFDKNNNKILTHYSECIFRKSEN